MHKHQQLLRQIIILGVGLVVAGALIGFDIGLTEGGPGWPFYLGLVLLAVLGLFGARWVFTSAEALTSSAVAELPPFWLVIYILAIVALIVLLPVAIVILAIRYWIARARFQRNAAVDRAA